MRRLSVLLLVGMVFGLVSAPTSAAAEETVLSPSCGLFVAHRGEHSRWTENTLRSMRAAVRVGADYVEVDVRETAGSGLVLMHDAMINRTTRSSGRVSLMTMRALRRVVLNDGTRITSLRDNLEAIKGSSIKVMLEIKAMNSATAYARLVRQINAFGIDRVTVTSFKPRVLHAVRAVEPDVALSLVTADPPTFEQAVTYGSVSPHYSQVTEEWLLAMRTAGYPVYPWTVNERATWSQLNGRVEAIITDESTAFARWRQTATCPEVTTAP